MNIDEKKSQLSNEDYYNAYQKRCALENITDLKGVPFSSPPDFSTMSEEKKRSLTPLETIPPQLCRLAGQMVSERRCLKCWLKNEMCLCPLLTSLCPTLEIPHRLIVMLHKHEFSRASNTGKLLARLVSNAEMLIFNVMPMSFSNLFTSTA